MLRLAPALGVGGSISDAGLAVARILHRTLAEGPYLRTAVWVSDCCFRCAGCINPHLFEPGGDVMEPAALAAEIVEAEVEGVSFLGGEPFDQAGPCADVAELVRGEGVGVMTFTGFEYEGLAVRDEGSRRLLAATDLLVDGPYRFESPEPARSLVGSTNQRFVHLTDRYRGFDPFTHPNRLDIRIEPMGNVRLAGFLTRDQLRELK